MKKLIQVLIVCGLFVVIGGTASGEKLSKEEMDAENEKYEEAKKNKDWVLAKEIATTLAEKGHVKSQRRLGSIYLYGLGEVPKDLKKAFKWLKPAAEQGDVLAQYNLGFMYRHGKGVPQDYKEAVKWFKKSAEQGDVDAQLTLGWMYDNGKEVPQDYKEAVKWR